jgi:L-iditol 2-dehydrogenase
MEDLHASVSVKEGDFVAVAPYVPCFVCPLCARGRHELCRHKDWIDGGFAEYVAVPAGVLEKGTFRVPDGLDLRVAALAEPLACCLNAVADSNVHMGDTVLVIGAGPMGMMMLESCKAAGATRLLASEPDELRRSQAQGRGAQAVDPGRTSAAAWVNDLTGGAGADVVFVCVGAAEAVGEAMAAAGPGGTVNVFGGLSGGTTISVDAKRVHYDEVTLTGSFGFAPEHFRTALAMLASGRLNVEGIITHEFGLDDAASAFETAAAGKCLKAVIRVGKDG